MRRQTFFLLIVAVIIAINYSEINNGCEKIEDSIVSAAMISDRKHTKDPNVLRDQETVSNFTKVVFKNYPEDIKIRYWPPIMSRSCDMDGPEAYDKGRGSNLAHKEIWDNFYRNRRKCGSKDALIVFEYDAFLGYPNAGNLAVEYAKNMTTDFLFLGYCYHKPQHHPRLGGKAPYCLHAYALSVEGARKLGLLLDACGPFADAQVARYADAGLLSWSYVNHSVDQIYVNHEYQSRGIHISGRFQYDGIFLQVKLDQLIDKLQEGTVIHNSKRPRLLFVLYINQWRRLPSMDMFHSLGIEIEKVKTLSQWQFNKYSEGDVMTDSNIADLKLRIPARNSSLLRKGVNDPYKTRIGTKIGNLEHKNRTKVTTSIVDGREV
jgi:hypothetical protein